VNILWQWLFSNKSSYIIFYIHRRRRRWSKGGTCPPLGSYPGRSGTYPGKFKNIRANPKTNTFIYNFF